ncbi:MAG: hypothetical protein KAT69_07105 [Candidatus Aminicenantes bacterium]|nr:hypothetical protein [Candidatus Aminicenantes bacterium]
MPEYKYKKICELARCGKPFKTNRKNQRFCKTPHRIEWHQAQKSEISDILRRLDVLEKEIKKLKAGMNSQDLKITHDLKIMPDLHTMRPHYQKRSGKEVNDQKKKRPSSNGEEGA